jgi:hypothetical protein
VNANTDSLILELEPVASAQPDQPAHLPALAENSPAGMMLAALRQGADIEKIEKMLDLQERWEKREAEKAFNAAFAAFRGEDLEVLKDKARTSGPLQGQKYATLHAFVKATKGALSRHGLGVRWDVTRDEPDWIEVTCILKHEKGHFETVAMGGPPDTGPARNILQARHSTVSYLERYTLKAICGLAEQEDDDDGNGGAKSALVDTWVKKAQEAQTYEETNRIAKDGADAFNKARDVEGYRQFAAALQQRRTALKKAVGNA